MEAKSTTETSTSYLELKNTLCSVLEKRGAMEKLRAQVPQFSPPRTCCYAGCVCMHVLVLELIDRKQVGKLMVLLSRILLFVVRFAPNCLLKSTIQLLRLHRCFRLRPLERQSY